MPQVLTDGDTLFGGERRDRPIPIGSRIIGTQGKKPHGELILAFTHDYHGQSNDIAVVHWDDGGRYSALWAGHVIPE